MRRALEEAHGGIYRYTSKREMDRTFDRAYRKIDHPMTGLEFWRLSAPVVAHIKCGHTLLWWPEEVQKRIDDEIPLYPQDVEVLEKRVYVYRDWTSDDRKLDGREILSINGVRMTTILDRMMTVVTGDGNTSAAKSYLIGHRRWFSAYLFALLEIHSPFRVEYRDGAGKRETVELMGMKCDKRDALRAKEPTPQTTADLKFLDDGKTAVLTIRSFRKFIDDQRTQPLHDFLQKSFEQVHDKSSRDLIIDLRGNTGGEDAPGKQLFSSLWDQPFKYYRDLVLNAREFDFFKYAPGSKPVPADLVEQQADRKFHYVKHPNWGLQPPSKPHFAGKVFVLMNGGSFSTTCEFLSVLHFHKRGIFIGEEPAGGYYGNTSGFFARVVFPNSKLTMPVRLTTYYMAVGGYKYPDRGVMPDYPVTYTIDDVLAGKDKDMELALSLARGK